MANSIANQLVAGQKGISGIIVESFLVEGNQKVVAGEPLTYGQSITDACVNLDTSEEILQILSKAVQATR